MRFEVVVLKSKTRKRAEEIDDMRKRITRAHEVDGDAVHWKESLRSFDLKSNTVV